MLEQKVTWADNDVEVSLHTNTLLVLLFQLLMEKIREGGKCDESRLLIDQQSWRRQTAQTACENVSHLPVRDMNGDRHEWLHPQGHGSRLEVGGLPLQAMISTIALKD